MNIVRLENTMFADIDATEVNQGRTFQHMGNTRDLVGAQAKYSDLSVAHSVRMLMRDDLHHEAKVCMARDRILCLLEEKEVLLKMLTEAAHTAKIACYETRHVTLGDEVYARVLALTDPDREIDEPKSEGDYGIG